MSRTLADVQRDIAARAVAQADRPQIVVTGRHLRDLSAEALGVLQAQPLYERAGFVVRVNNGAAERLTGASLKGILERAADFVKETMRDGVPVTTPARVPGDVPADILSLPADALPFPRLHTIAKTPVLLPSGELLMRDGHDPETGILLCLDGLSGLRHDLPLSQAVELVDELLGDFPFTDDAGRAHAYAMLLQPVVRPVILGPTPLYLVDAPLRGTGKGLITDVCTIVPTGRTAPIMPLTRDGDELDKRITTLLVDGATHVLLDNVTQIRSAVLAAALTSEVWRGRILGKSEMVHVRNDATWIASGNNVELSDEVARRVMPIRLDAGVERPEERRGFRHPRLKEWTFANRERLLSAVLSIVRAWVEEGMPRGEASIGSFESWSGVMGGILGVAGVSGLLGGREDLHSHTDRETAEWAAFLAAWHEVFGVRPVTAGELFDVLKERNLLLDLWAGRSNIGAQQRLGHALKARRDRIYGGLRIRWAGQDSATRNTAYRLEESGSSGDGNKHPKHPQTPEEGTNDPIASVHAEGDVSGVSGVSVRPYTPKVESSGPLTERASTLASNIRSLNAEAARGQAASALSSLGNVPGWWHVKARSEPHTVLLAAELIRADMAAGGLAPNAYLYLSAAQAALEGEVTA